MTTLLSWFKPFGIDFFCVGKKFLVFNMVSRNLKIKYRRSIFGVFWTLLTPMAMTMIYYFVFKVIMKVQVPHYLAFVVGGILPWTFFSQTLAEGMESIVGSLGLVSKVPIPVQLFPYVNAITNFITLMIASPILVALSVVSKVPFGPWMILLPVYLVILFLVAYSLSLALSILFVYFRDLRHLLGIFLQLWFYGTPVIYDEKMIPERFSWIIYLNPVGTIFTGFHKVLVSGTWPSAVEIYSTLAWCVFFLLLSCFFYKILGHEVVEKL